MSIEIISVKYVWFPTRVPQAVYENHPESSSEKKSLKSVTQSVNLEVNFASMPGADFGIVLTVLRIIRGWTQEELARASGMRGGTISDYERGKMAPSHKTLHRLLEAMGYPLSALDQVGALIDSLRADNPVTEPLDELWLSGGPAALRREIAQVSADAGRVVSRLTRLMFVVMSSATSEDTRGDLQSGG